MTKKGVDMAKLSEFMSMTGTDADFARSFLDNHQWAVGPAVTAFFESAGSTQEEEVRKPLPAKNDQLVEPAVMMRVARRPEASNPWKDRTLAGMFKPPTDLSFRGSFDEVLHVAERDHKWVMVNIQQNTEFASHQLNRDTWQDAQVRKVLAKSFLFWQTLADDPQGRAFVALYQPPQLPVIAIVDPRTRQEMAQWTGYIDPKRLNLLMLDFLEDNDILSTAPTRSKHNREDEAVGPQKKLKKVMDMTDEEQLALALEASISSSVALEKPRNEPALAPVDASASSSSAPLYNEPEPDIGANITQVQLRLPGGKKVTRRFTLDHRVDELYRFVSSLLENSKEFLLVTSYPKKQLLDRSLTLQEAKLQNSSLIVELT